MQVSYSRVGTFHQCPFKFKLRYKDKLEAYPKTDDPTNALILGHALHTGIEKDIEAAIKEYYSAFPVISDRHIEEAEKLKYRLKQCKEILPDGLHETKIEIVDDFIGFIDLLVPIEWKPDEIGVTEDQWYDLYDFKYSNNVKNYMTSEQLHVYKWYFEKLNPGKYVRNLYFLFVPKVNIRQKKTETMERFRLRIREELAKEAPKLQKVNYDVEKVKNFLRGAKGCREATTFPKIPTRLCDWCEYQKYCEEGETLEIMNLPKNERVEISEINYMKGWIFGPPFSGKTTFLDAAPDPLNLNTDGNTKYVTMQRIRIRDEVKVEGRITRRKFAWEILKEVIDELEKGSEFKTILLDLVEDTREMCRLYMYDKLGIQHESDSGYGKGWDIIKLEYLSTIKRLLALDYNIFLVSHEDISKEVTKYSGEKITKIAPNIQEAIATKLAGMVDFVARVIVKDDGTRVLSFKSNEVTFGGGRLQITEKEIPLEWDELVKVYDAAIANFKAKALKTETPKKKAVKEEPKDEPVKNEFPEDENVHEVVREVTEVTEVTEEKPLKRKARKKVADVVEETKEEAIEETKEEVVEEQPRRRRRRGA